MLRSRFCPTSRDDTIDLDWCRNCQRRENSCRPPSFQIFFSSLVNAREASSGFVHNVEEIEEENCEPINMLSDFAQSLYCFDIVCDKKFILILLPVSYGKPQFCALLAVIVKHGNDVCLAFAYVVREGGIPFQVFNSC